jgi:hypothetical protein
MIRSVVSNKFGHSIRSLLAAKPLLAVSLSLSFESFQAHDRRAFNGLCLVIVRGKPGPAGTIRLTAKADGLKLGAAHIKTISKHL